MLLLLSNSTNPGEPWLEWPLRQIEAHFQGLREIFFVPYAGVRTSWDEYAEQFRRRLEPIGCRVRSAHEFASPGVAVGDADAVAIGGGNTFQLLDRLYAAELLEPIRQRISDGAPYLGWSAGSVVACPTIGTTNDMPIVEPPSFAALGLVPFQINPHFTEARLPQHNGETRVERLEEYLIANPAATVVGLPEGTGLRIDGGRPVLIGAQPCTVFRKGQAPALQQPGSELELG